MSQHGQDVALGTLALLSTIHGLLPAVPLYGQVCLVLVCMGNVLQCCCIAGNVAKCGSVASGNVQGGVNSSAMQI